MMTPHQRKHTHLFWQYKFRESVSYSQIMFNAASIIDLLGTNHAAS